MPDLTHASFNPGHKSSKRIQKALSIRKKIRKQHRVNKSKNKNRKPNSPVMFLKFNFLNSLEIGKNNHKKNKQKDNSRFFDRKEQSDTQSKIR